MKFSTNRFGDLELNEENILHVKDGIIGFPECTRVILLDHAPNSPFKWMQSLDQPELAFVVIDPLDIDPTYPLQLLGKLIGVDYKEPEDLAVAAIATVPPAPAPITVNLVAPIVFSSETKKGSQVILHDERFETRHTLATD